MDYRDLIDTLRHGDPLDIVVQAYEMADAVETLLKERDAAMSKKHGECDECVRVDKDVDDFPCCDCCYTYMDWDKSDHWRWRGPREGQTDNNIRK